jgi:hypothetical protein
MSLYRVSWRLPDFPGFKLETKFPIFVRRNEGGSPEAGKRRLRRRVDRENRDFDRRKVGTSPAAGGLEGHPGANVIKLFSS